VTPHVCPGPALSCWKAWPPLTWTGELAQNVAPSQGTRLTPSSPLLLLPQHQAAPAPSSAQKWIGPATMLVYVWPPATATGKKEKPFPPQPSRAADPSVPVDHHVATRWLRQAEKLAGLTPLQGGVWHPFRRGWATARKGLSLKDVAEAGGWKDTTTLLKCYMQSDEETLAAVVMNDRPLRAAR
jgi:hypothetical protein